MAEELPSNLPRSPGSSADEDGNASQTHDAVSHFASTMDGVRNWPGERPSGTISSDAPQSSQSDNDATPTTTNTTHPYARLASGLDRIFSRSDDFDLKAYMSFYTEVHRTVTAQKAARKSTHQRHSRGAHLLGEDLYYFVRDYLHNHARSVHDEIIMQPGDRLIPFYLEEWRRYVAAAKRNKHLLSFLNRHWVKRELDEGKKNVYEIYHLHLMAWKNEVLQADSEPSTSVLSMLRKRIEESETGRDESEVEDLEEVRESFVVVGHPGEEHEVNEVRESLAAVGIKESEGSEVDEEVPTIERTRESSGNTT